MSNCLEYTYFLPPPTTIVFHFFYKIILKNLSLEVILQILVNVFIDSQITKNILLKAILVDFCEKALFERLYPRDP